MKLPGIGEVKNEYVYIGVAVSLGGIWYYRRKSAQAAATQAAAVAATQTAGDGIDPSTGLPYSQEGAANSGDAGFYGATDFGGIDPATGVPYIYESGSSKSAGSSNPIATNQQWAQEAEGELINTFGYSQSLATSAVSKYIGQHVGLNSDEYEAMSVVIGELGPPPSGTFRLMQATGVTGNPPSGGGGPVGTGGPTMATGPWNLGAIVKGPTEVDLSWASQGSNAPNGYQVNYGMNGNVNQFHYRVSGTSARVGALKPGTAWIFNVQAVVGNSLSPASATVTVTTPQ